MFLKTDKKRYLLFTHPKTKNVTIDLFSFDELFQSLSNPFDTAPDPDQTITPLKQKQGMSSANN